jgi:hypothetical protein
MRDGSCRSVVLLSARRAPGARRQPRVRAAGMAWPRRHGHGHRDGSDGGEMKVREDKGEDEICVEKKVREDTAR